MSSNTSPPTNGNGSSTGAPSKDPTGSTQTAAHLVAALKKARADRDAAAALAAAQASADKAAANSADSCTAAWIRSAARGNAQAAAKAAAESRTVAKQVLQDQRIADAAAARAAAADAAKATREAAYNAAHIEWKKLFDKAEAEHNACANATGDHSKYLLAVKFARVASEFDKLCSDCRSLDKNVADAAENLKQLVDEYQKLLAEKAEAVKKVANEEPEHPDVVFKRQFAIFIQKNKAIERILLYLLEGRAVRANKFVAAGFDPNFLRMFGRLFVLSSVNDSVTLNPNELPTYNSLKDKAKAGRDAFHLWFLQHVIFSFIQNRLVPLIDVSSNRILEVLMLNYKYILPMHIHDRDAQIAEHSANIQKTMEYHLQMKEKKRRKNREATNEELEKHFRDCEEHSRQEAAEDKKMRELADSVKVFLQDQVNNDLLSNLKSFGIHDNDSAWNNSTSSTHSLVNFLAKNGLPKFEDAIRFLQRAGIIAGRVSHIPTKRNPTREAFAFIFGKNDKSSSENEDDSVEHAAESAPEKTQQPSNKTLRIIRGDDDLTLANAIREANLEKKLLASKESSKAEGSSANEQTEAKLPLSSPPAPSFPSRSQFVLSPEKAKAIGSENGIKPETMSMVVMMKGVQSISAALRPDVINAAKRMDAQIYVKKSASEDKAAKEAAEEFKQENTLDQKRAILLARLEQRRFEMKSGSVGGGASASAAVVSSTEEDLRLTLSELTSQNGKVIESKCGGLLSRVKAASSKNEGQPIAEQSAEQNE